MYPCVYKAVNKDGYILHKAAHKKGRRHDYDVYKGSHPCTPKQVVNVLDLGYLGVEKDFPEQLYLYYYPKGKEINELSNEKEQSITKSMLKRG
jgi:hypothetical protein